MLSSFRSNKDGISLKSQQSITDIQHQEFHIQKEDFPNQLAPIADKIYFEQNDFSPLEKEYHPWKIIQTSKGLESIQKIFFQMNRTLVFQLIFLKELAMLSMFFFLLIIKQSLSVVIFIL